MPRPTPPSRRFGTPQAATLIVALLVLFGSLPWLVPFLIRNNLVVTSVASGQDRSIFKLTTFALPSHQRACMNRVTVTANSRLVRFTPRPAVGALDGGPPLDVLITAHGYQSVAHLPGGYRRHPFKETGEERERRAQGGAQVGSEVERKEEGQAEQHRHAGRATEAGVGEEGEYEPERGTQESGRRWITQRQSLPITPPAHALLATVCFINTGNTTALLLGTHEPRMTSRSVLTIGGKPVAGSLTLFFAGARGSRLGRVGEIFEHTSDLTDHLVPVWLAWILIVSALIGLPVGAAVAFSRALRDDEAVPRS